MDQGKAFALAGTMKTHQEPRPSFEQLHALYAPRVRSYLQRFVDATEVDDLTQEVFLKAHQGLEGFRGQCKVSTWIFQIATHAALDRIRSPLHHLSRQKLIPDSILNSSLEPSAPSHESNPLHTEMCKCIRGLVDELPLDFRTIIHLSELKELKISEIAQILGISPGAAKIRLHRARQALRKRMEVDCRILLDERAEIQCDRKNG
jgi:RNA polymerase sigma-70 factor, ECF subfamily